MNDAPATPPRRVRVHGRSAPKAAPQVEEASPDEMTKWPSTPRPEFEPASVTLLQRSVDPDGKFVPMSLLGTVAVAAVVQALTINLLKQQRPR